MVENGYRRTKMTSRMMPELDPCPKCGKHPVSLRHIANKAGIKPYAVCCGGEGCCFYVTGDTEKEAIKAWNGGE